MYAIICYDVPAKRTNLYRKHLLKYLIATQNSVFSGDITQSLYEKMLKELDRIRSKDDSLLFITTKNRHNIQVNVIQNGIIDKDESHLGSGIL